jgi:hypothetical protein
MAFSGPGDNAALSFGYSLLYSFIPSHIRIFLQTLPPSNQFQRRRHTAFGRLAAHRNVIVPANMLLAVGPMPHCKTSRQTVRRA